MTTDKDNKETKKGTLSLGSGSKLQLNRTVDISTIKSNIATQYQSSKSKTITVEVRKSRSATRESLADKIEDHKEATSQEAHDILTSEEKKARLNALKVAAEMDHEEEKRKLQKKQNVEQLDKIEEENIVEKLDVNDSTLAKNEFEAAEVKTEKTETQTKRINKTISSGVDNLKNPDKVIKKIVVDTDFAPKPTEEKKEIKKIGIVNSIKLVDDDEEFNKKVKKSTVRTEVKEYVAKSDDKRFRGKNLEKLLTEEESEVERTRSLASIKRAREKAKKNEVNLQKESEKQIREVILPEVITVQELASRMAERATDVVKELMKLGMFVNVSQNIDADTAELVIDSFGHKVKRVTEADVENILADVDDAESDLEPRSPVVTIMGHVDHGKTSLLDALRSTDVVSGEAGGITQHIGAYQVHLKNGKSITFLDTPGHEAFTAMRSRGAKVTDIVVLVVAADDGIMAQTIEAINHAKAAEVPIIVAINKIDKPAADPYRVKNELLSNGIVVEEFGGDVMSVEVSAKNMINLDKLEEAILLQAEILDLKANPSRTARGAIIEAKIDKSRGVITSLLVQKGTLKIGDIVVAGMSYGRVRLISNDHGQNLPQAFPSMPVEILGLDSAPEAGDNFAVVSNEKQARDIVEFRQRKARDIKTLGKKGSLEELFMKASSNGKIKDLPIIIKGDVHGSVEAINGSLAKIEHEEVKVKVLHAAVGAISESDIALAKASRAIILGFNVRASGKAKEMADKENVDIRYYSIIYNLIDDVKAVLGGMLTPIMREEYLGSVEIRQVFNITKIGKVAGAFVTKGIIKRGSKVRLLRDNIVIHEGKLKTLKRFKDDVKEAKEGFECGIAFENYDDIKEGDTVEVFEIVEEKKTI